MISSRRRWLLSALVVSLALTSWSGVLDREADAYLDRAMTQAVTAFAIARGINAVLSVAKGSEVSVEPFGVGVSLAVGQILDPVDDLVERFSWVMLVAIVALGVQKLMLALGGTLAVNLFMTALAAVVLITVWRPLLLDTRISRGAMHLLIVTFVLRFVMVAVALASDAAHSGLVGERVDHATEQLSVAESQLTRLAGDQDEDAEVALGSEVERAPWWTRLDELWEDAAVDPSAHPVDDTDEVSSWDPRARLDALQQASRHAIDHLLSLAAAFITQTVVLPILFLWLALKLSGGLLRSITTGERKHALP
jgi:hypothetical protein